MTGLKFDAVIIGIGSILFLVSAFLPISRVYALPTPEKKLALINQSRKAWQVSHFLFFIGALLVAIGVVVFAFSNKEKSFTIALYFAAGLLIIGLTGWSWHLYLRTLDPLAFVKGALPAWHFQLYTVFTLIAFLLIGIAMSGLGFPFWASWVLMFASTLFFVLFIIFKDLPPFSLYLMGLFLSFLLFQAG
ncbi:MAG: hypothetical protein HGB14_06665 [Anaerolineaceae bacterium]|nr:hypothetical protein [Anaerolineaceae bacterium]